MITDKTEIKVYYSVHSAFAVVITIFSLNILSWALFLDKEKTDYQFFLYIPVLSLMLCLTVYRLLTIIYWKKKKKIAVLINDKGISANGFGAKNNFFIPWRDVENVHYIHSYFPYLVIIPRYDSYECMVHHKMELIINQLFLKDNLHDIFSIIRQYHRSETTLGEQSNGDTSKKILCQLYFLTIFLLSFSYLVIKS